MPASVIIGEHDGILHAPTVFRYLHSPAHAKGVPVHVSWLDGSRHAEFVANPAARRRVTERIKAHLMMARKEWS